MVGARGPGPDAVRARAAPAPALEPLPLAVAIAVAEACEAVAPVKCRIKWPNDVWIDGLQGLREC